MATWAFERCTACVFSLAVAMLIAGIARADKPAHHISAEEARQVPPLRLTEDLSIGVADPETGPAFGRVVSIAVSAAGEIFVLDRGWYQVWVFSESGVPLRTISSRGEGPGEFSYPDYLALGPRDRLYVVDGRKVKVYATSGEYLEEFPIEQARSFVRGMVVDDGGNLYLSSFNDADKQLIHKYGPDHEWILSFCDSYFAGQDVDPRIERFSAGGSIDRAANGNLLFAQAYPYELRVFSAAGELLQRMSRETDFVALPEIEITGDRTTYTSRGGCFGIVALPSGAYLVTANRLPSKEGDEGETLVDCYGPQGELLATQRRAGFFDIQCADSLGRVYATPFNEDYPRVVRYRVDW
ncbi:MAG: 6-bladed beta-propeller [Candidatus Krumholzibacteriia bacterium]